MADLRKLYKDEVDFAVLALEDPAFNKQLDHHYDQYNISALSADHDLASSPMDNLTSATQQLSSKKPLSL